PEVGSRGDRALLGRFLGLGIPSIETPEAVASEPSFARRAFPYVRVLRDPIGAGSSAAASVAPCRTPRPRHGWLLARRLRLFAWGRRRYLAGASPPELTFGWI